MPEKATHTPRRTVRIADDVWLSFCAAARRDGCTPSDALRRLMTRYIAAQRRRAAREFREEQSRREHKQ